MKKDKKVALIISVSLIIVISVIFIMLVDNKNIFDIITFVITALIYGAVIYSLLKIDTSNIGQNDKCPICSSEMYLIEGRNICCNCYFED